MEKPRLRFTLLGRFQYAIGQGEYKELDVTPIKSAILAYMAFSGTQCSYDRIDDNCWEETDKPNSGDALRKRLDSVKELFTEDNLKWEDYITADAKKRIFYLNPGTYETDLQTFLGYYEAAEGAEENEYGRLMNEANKCYKGDLLEGVKGKWIKAERAEIKAKSEKAKEAANRYAAIKQEAKHFVSSEAIGIEERTPLGATLSSHIAPGLPSIHTRVQDEDTARRLGRAPWLTWVAVAVLVTSFVLLRIKHGHDAVVPTSTEVTATTLPSRPVAFDAVDWRPENYRPPAGVTPEDGFTNLHLFRLRKAIAVPQDFTKLYVSISCGEKAHVVLAQLNEPEGNTEVATDGQTHRKWEWESGRSRRTMNGKMVVEVIAWLGTKPGDSTPPAIEGEYWFDLPEKEN